jgi:hypothetical protein
MLWLMSESSAIVPFSQTFPLFADIARSLGESVEEITTLHQPMSINDIQRHR